MYGNEKLIEKLRSDIGEGKLMHAYMISGAKGSGKHTLAKEIAVMLAGDSAAEREKIMGGICPDVVTVGLTGERRTLGVDAVRRIRSEAYIVPNELDIRVFIVEDAHLMTVQAQNSFLKILEEPPAGVYFLLLCGSTAPILPTVKSRAPELRMEVFTDESVKEYLLSNEKKAKDLAKKDPEALNFAVHLAEGSIGAAIENLSSKKSGKERDIYEKVENLFQTLGRKNRSALVVLIRDMPSKREELISMLSYAETYSADMAKSKLTKNAAGSSAASAFTLGEICGINAVITKLKSDLSSNINIQTAQTYLINELWRTVTN